MLQGGISRAVFSLVGFLDSHWCGDFCDSKFEHSGGGNKISLLEIRDFPGLYHVRIHRMRYAYHPLALASQGYPNFISGQKFKKKNSDFGGGGETYRRKQAERAVRGRRSRLSEDQPLFSLFFDFILVGAQNR